MTVVPCALTVGPSKGVWVDVETVGITTVQGFALAVLCKSRYGRMLCRMWARCASERRGCAERPSKLLVQVYTRMFSYVRSIIQEIHYHIGRPPPLDRLHYPSYKKRDRSSPVKEGGLILGWQALNSRSPPGCTRNSTVRWRWNQRASLFSHRTSPL